ncbi:MAG: ATP-binding protein [Myxococcota bacterium]
MGRIAQWTRAPYGLSALVEQTHEPFTADLPTLMVTSVNQVGRAYPIDPVAIIGSDRGADICVSDGNLLPKHACIWKTQAGGYEICAFGPDVRVNGRPVKYAALSVGDRVVLGARTVLSLTAGDHFKGEATAPTHRDSLRLFAGGIGHEFNNLLGSVTSNLGFIRRVLKDGTPARLDAIHPAIADAEQAVTRAAELTSRLVGLADQSREAHSADVSRIVRETAALVLRQMRSKIDVEVVAPGAIFVRADSNALRQALQQLCANACDAMPDGGTIGLTVVAESDKKVRVEVTDSGVGMNAEAQMCAFEPFFTTKPGRGTGLGLSMVDRIIREHRGQISLLSQPGQGTRVSLTLPMATAPSCSECVLTTGSEVSDEPIIFWVDDHGLFRRGAEHLLSGLGLRVESVAGVTAVDRFAEVREDVELVVLDVPVATVPAEEIVLRLRALRNDVRVLVLNSSQGDSISDILRLGACGVLEKSTEADALRRGILEAIGSED